MGMKVTGIRCGGCGHMTDSWQSAEGMDGCMWELWKCASCGNEIEIRSEWVRK